MRTFTFAAVFMSICFLVTASTGFTASTLADDQITGSSLGEGKHLGVKLTGNPSAIHKVLIGFKTTPGSAEESIVTSLGGKIKYAYHLVPAIAATIPEAAIEGLLRNPRVTHIDPDGMVRAIGELDNTWGVQRIGAGIVHAKGNMGAVKDSTGARIGVNVAVIDTGIDCTHPDLKPNCFGGYDFVNKDAVPMDDNGHGTHVAGTVAASYNNTGVVGVAPEARLYALKVLDLNGSGYWSDVIAALQWAVTNKMQVTNNSYGDSLDPGTTVKQAFDNAHKAGVLNVAAAGNSGNAQGTGDNVGYPARYPSVIAAAATDITDARAEFSSTGPDVDLAAPGVDIPSTCSSNSPDPFYILACVFGGKYVELSGTSMASPHVAGSAALVMASNITDSNSNGRVNDEVRQRLVNNADDRYNTGWDPYYGFGIVRADAAVTPLPSTPPIAEDLNVATPKNTPREITLAAKDGTGGTLADGYSIVTDPSHGTLSGTAPSVTYTPAAGYEGTDSFTYRATDGKAESNEATVNITVGQGGSVNNPPVASFTANPTSGPAPLTVSFDATASTDTDGSIVSYSWAFGDRSNGSGETASHIYSNPGTYTVVLTVTDNGGATGTASQTITVFPTMHVGDLDGSATAGKRSWKATVTITVHDANHSPLSGAAVSGGWSSGGSGSGSCTTGVNGQCSVTSSAISNKNNSVTFTVSGVTKAPYFYQSGANHDPDGDSNGTVITVRKP